MANEQDKDNDMQENKKDKSRKSAIFAAAWSSCNMSATT